MNTVEELAAQFTAEIHRPGGGMVCPCCDRFGKVHRRKINSSMAAVLIDMAKRPVGEWIDSRDYYGLDAKPVRCMEIGKLRHYGFVEAKPLEPGQDQKDSGFWRVTTKGRLFAQGMIKVRPIAVTFDNRCLSREGDHVFIQECLGDRFSYPELMAS